MKLNHPLLTRLSGLLGAKAIRAWMNTLDYQCAYYDPAVDPVHPEFSGNKIYLLWHEYILFPINLRGNCNMTMLLSRHRDAEVLAQAARHLGFGTVRGSTGRGGIAALRELAAESRQMNLIITPDGPRGPRRHLASGPIYLASKLRMPIIATGFGYDRPWRMRSWDRFALPRPFTRARAVVSPEIHIPPKLDRESIEFYRQRVETLLNRLTDEAETWAESGTRKVGQVVMRREPVRRRVTRVDQSHQRLRGPTQRRESNEALQPAKKVNQG
ncbi:MAG: lysophospholipid acyltransferase family protein [Planctomycetes bacterium]|nr:lysophospholipid acyltransferase family protein [Planctomycetota bacterium]